MKQVFLKPAEGRLVRDHNDDLTPLAAEGKLVVLDPTWRKRIAQGDVIVIEPEKAKAPAKAEPVEKK